MTVNYNNSSNRMRKYFIWYVFTFLCVMIVFSCQEDKDISPGPSVLDEYYPLETGDIRTYSVDSITYDYDGDLQRIVIDTSKFFLQERVLESVELSGETWYRVGQFRANSPNGDYQLTNYAYERITPRRLLRKEGNLTFVSLASPLTLFDEWDGTAYFDASSTTRFVRGEVIQPYQGWNYIYLDKWDDYEVEGQSYHDVIQINQRDTTSISSSNDNSLIPPEEQLFYYLANEFYAPQAGLIKKEEFHLSSICASSSVDDFQTFCDTTTIFENAERGYIFRKKLISIE